jgi:hypothetical protein
VAKCENCSNFFLGFCEVHIEDVPRGAWTKEHGCPDWLLESPGLRVIKDWLAEDDTEEVRRFLDVFEGKIEVPQDLRESIWKALSPAKREVMKRFYDAGE